MSEPETEVAKLSSSLEEYEQQLHVVEAALMGGDDAQKAELLDLQAKLKEVIQLTKEGLETLKQKTVVGFGVHQDCQETSTSNESDMDLEFLRFQAEMASLGDTVLSSTIETTPVTTSRDTSSEDDGLSETDEEFYKIISSLSGQRCQAPFQQEWGQLHYHSAIILSADMHKDENAQSINCVRVRVMFTNPTCEMMKPCPFFLDDTCKFSDDKCRFSHGYDVAFSDIREYVEPDFSCLGKDSTCFVKYSDGIWYKAVIEDISQDNKFTVKFTDYGNVEVVGAEDIFPLGSTEDISGGGSTDSESEDGVSSLDEAAPYVHPVVTTLAENTSVSALGEWEKHTTGIGSKLLFKMGYIWGQGLGKNGEGRTEPVSAVVLPQGKSLDKCMELKEKNQLRDAFKLKAKLKRQQKKKDDTISSGYHLPAHKTIFDFLNRKISNPKPEHGRKVKLAQRPLVNNVQDLRRSSDRGLNVQSLQVTEDIRRAEQEITRLQQASLRNRDKDKLVHAQLQQKISVQQQLIKNLQLQERSIQKEQNDRKVKQKLAVF